MNTETTVSTNQEKTPKSNGQAAGKNGAKQQQRIISHPGDVAGLVMMQIDAVNAKKDELTIAIKGLTDTSKQLVRAYAEHSRAIAKLQQRIKTLEEKLKEKG